MANEVVLIVSGNARDAAQLARAIEGLALPRPLILDSGEAAVLWIGANPCDVCVLDYTLPGIDGLEALTRLRQRRPDLPVVMVSGAESERVAIAAFHAGVVDYVPKKTGFADAVAKLVRQAAQSEADSALTPLPLAGADLPEALTQPTYQNRLRVIGRQLDLYNYQSANVLEVAGGFLVRAMSPRSRTPEALEFPDRDFPTLVVNAAHARGEGERKRTPLPLLPTGYEDFLRAVGRRLDEQHAEAVTLSDLGTFIAVGGVSVAEAYEQTRIGPLQWLMRDEDITFLLDESYRLRAASNKRSLFGRVIGKSAAERR
jgi:DNA-binding response OmpR family regulator